jgi:hypothetical protein
MNIIFIEIQKECIILSYKNIGKTKQGEDKDLIKVFRIKIYRVNKMLYNLIRKYK